MDIQVLEISLLGYVLGSIPFGLVWAKVFGFGDLRQIGSGNIGATNALRTGNKKLALLTLLSDLLKGTGAICLAKYVFPSAEHAAVFAAYGALFGHIFPIWLKFKGGKGVATGVGVLFGLSWPVAVLSLVMWLIVAFLGRMSSLAALIASLHAPVYAMAMGNQALAITLLPVTFLIWFTHRANIKRLLKGEESKIGQKK